MPRTLIAMIVSSVFPLLTGCNNHLPSPQAHAKSYVFKTKKDFDPNFYTKTSDTIKAMTPVFAQFYDMGAKDRQAGVGRSEAEKKAAAMYHDEALNRLQKQETFVNQTITSPAGKRRVHIFITEASGAYLDGFAGR